VQLYDATFGSNGGYDDNGAMSDPEGMYLRPGAYQKNF